MSASSGIAELQIRHEPVDDRGGRLESRLGQLGVDHGSLGVGVAQDLLDDAEIDALFQQVGGVGMTQGMDRGPLVDPGLGERLLEGNLHTGNGQRGRRGGFPAATPARGREEPLGMVVRLPQLPEELQRPRGEGDVAVLVPLTVDV